MNGHSLGMPRGIPRGDPSSRYPRLCTPL